VAFVAVFAGACGKGEAGSCYRERENVCIQYDRATAAAGKRTCANLVWTAGENSCAAAGRLGTCEGKDGSRIVYGGPPNNFTAASAESACVASGGRFAR
jgi:hypothetical protein